MTELPRMHIDTWEKAERNAATWMRSLGYRDSRVTSRGSDAGIDVFATGALAQVKFEAHATGRPALQRLVGARGHHDHKALLFFTGTNYSAAAIQYANEMNIALFKYDLGGSVQPVNGPARYLITSADGSPVRPSVRARSLGCISMLAGAVPLLIGVIGLFYARGWDFLGVALFILVGLLLIGLGTRGFAATAPRK